MELNVKNIIAEGLAYTVMGVVVVFLILIIIMFVIKAMELFSGEKAEKTVKPEPVQEDSLPEVKEVKKADDTELIAVITACIAASMGKSASSLIIRSYKKIQGDVWNKQGRREILENRF